MPNSDDLELTAIQTVTQALSGLEEEGRRRVIAYACARFGYAPTAAASGSGRGEPLPNAADVGNNRNDSNDSGTPRTFDSLAELYDAVSPETDNDKALTAGYWHQVCQGADSFSSQTINTDLKNLGHGIGNITRAFTLLKSLKPALVLQLQKAGTSKQARKTFKLTAAGLAAIRSKLQAN